MKTLCCPSLGAGLSSRFALHLLAVVVIAVWSLSAGITRGLAEDSAPPSFRDAVHVPRGCYISTMVFLARFHAEHPTERGEPLTLELASYDGPHTVALISWRGMLWGRDEYCGVFPLHVAVVSSSVVEIRRRAALALTRLSSQYLKRGLIDPATESERAMSPEARRAAVARAAALLPVRGEIWELRQGRERLPFLFFRPAAEQIAVYDPAYGTATAHCRACSPGLVVAAVLLRLGYGVPQERGLPLVRAVAALASE